MFAYKHQCHWDTLLRHNLRHTCTHDWLKHSVKSIAHAKSDLIYCCEIELHHKDIIIPLKLSLTSKLKNISIWYSWQHHQSSMIFLSNIPLLFEYSSNQQLNGFTFQGLKGLKGIVQSILPLIISQQETISLAFLCSTYFYSE